MATKKGLGEILVDAGLISEDQLEEALQLQKVHGERLASILVRQNVLTEMFAVTYLGRQLGVRGIDLSKETISLDLFKLVPLVLCNEKLVFPVRLERGQLQLVMSDPMDEALVAEIASKQHVRVFPCIALDASIKNAVTEAAAAVRAGKRSFTPSALHARLQRLSLETRARPTPPDSGPVPILAQVTGALPSLETLGGTDLAFGESFTRAKEASAPVSRLLLVEAEANAREVTKKLIGTPESTQVVAVATGAEALAQAEGAALVIVGRRVLDQSPLDLCREIKALRADLPVVLITASRRGWAFEADVREAFGVDVTLAPPFDSAELRRRIDDLLGLGGARDPEREASVMRQLRAGVAALKRDVVDEAIAAFEQGVREDPRSDLLHYYLGMTYERKEKLLEAIDHYERATELNPGFEDALVYLSKLYEKLGMRRKAVEIWQRVLSAAQDKTSRERIKAHLIELL